MTANQSSPASFQELGLPKYLLDAVEALGYQAPTPIQSQAIPALLGDSDVLGLAQTGTGKTAAFALPLLTKIQVKRREPQLLVLVPTRELALQVATAFSDFAVNMPEIIVLPIYGGQGYSTQLSMLRKGVQVVIGTPGRVMDHIRNEKLNLEHIKTIILDEADEMLRMGFAEDVEWILQQMPGKRQIGLFSATMPHAIKSIGEKYLHNPITISVKSTTSTATNIRQLYTVVNGSQKLEALSKVIEAEDTDGMIVFVRTKRATEELAEQLVERGFNAVAINGDIVQKQRERVISQLKSGKIDILIATDVAARGIDVERITHVINYDAPGNVESYIHRIGRTGRAGRSGTAIIFFTPREKFLIRNIERATKQNIEELPTPSIKNINAKRIANFKQKITDALATDYSVFEQYVNEYQAENNIEISKIAAALAKVLYGNKEFLLSKTSYSYAAKEGRGSSRDGDGERRSRNGERREFSRDRNESGRSRRSNDDGDDFTSRGRRRSDRDDDFAPRGNKRRAGGDDDFAPRGNRRGEDDFSRAPRNGSEGRSSRNSKTTAMESYRVELGSDDGLLPKNLVGAIANTAGLESRNIGKIKIESKFSYVDLPQGMPKNILHNLQKLKLLGKQMGIRKVT